MISNAIDPYIILARALALIIVIPVHEASHALVAYRLGDPTARNMGRLSLNPIRHFDLMGSISLLIIGIGWAKPVPIDARNFKNPRAGMALSAAAGPLSNMLLAFIAMVLMKLMLFSGFRQSSAAASYAYQVVVYICILNIALGIFNMMPFPPFDGSRIYSAFLPEKLYFGVMRYERYVFFAVLALLVLGVLDAPLQYLNNAVFNGLNFLTGWIDLLFQLAR
ncbi:MAG: hypothetical protein PWQ08_595 [Clostridiales bacterium]|jgi:Zn-dependent protease|nr:hypothetical protein [Clostridiales bacterium]